MIKKLIVLLDDASVPFCHYKVESHSSKMISEASLRKGIEYARRHDLSVVAIMPNHDVPQSLMSLLDGDAQYVVGYGSALSDSAASIVINGACGLSSVDFVDGKHYVLHTSKDDFFEHWHDLPFDKDVRVDVHICDVEDFSDSDFATYHTLLANMADVLTQKYSAGFRSNIITDRIDFNSMHNCGAGEESVTLAPDGKFYVCPGFYYDSLPALGIAGDELEIKNQHLFSVPFAPICRHCDAYHCSRCIYLNKKTTLEVNTPSHQQCVVAHTERAASRQLLLQMQDSGLLTDKHIKDIHYSDPFDVRLEWVNIDNR